MEEHRIRAKGRRSFLKGFIGLPVVAYLWQQAYGKNKTENPIISDFNEWSNDSHMQDETTDLPVSGPTIRLGIVGNGRRGPGLDAALPDCGDGGAGRGAHGSSGQPHTAFGHVQFPVIIRDCGFCET